MTQRNQIYKCNVCGNIVEVLHTGAGQLVCCQKSMELLQEKPEDEAFEKHVPVIETLAPSGVQGTESGIRIKVGTVPHPMQEDHYIEWIEVIAGNKIYRKFLSPGENPEAEFDIAFDKVMARAYCNLHGLWSSE